MHTVFSSPFSVSPSKVNLTEKIASINMRHITLLSLKKTNCPTVPAMSVCVKTHRPVPVSEPLPAPAKAGVCESSLTKFQFNLSTSFRENNF